VAVPQPTWHTAIATFKRDLIERALKQTCGNRTRAARALGLQRTYLLRLMREMGVTVPRRKPVSCPMISGGSRPR
jgi:DNA-binding NtrC family response regulator